MYFYDGKVSRIDGASVTIILCLHVLIARRILLILDIFIIFSEYRCLKRYSNMTSFIGYINNTMIKLTIYFKSHMRSDEQIKHIIPW